MSLHARLISCKQAASEIWVRKERLVVWQMLLVFIAGAIAASILPGTTEVAMAGAIGAFKLAPLPVIAAATAGSVFGSGVQWAIGRFFAQYKDHKRFPLKAAQYDKYAAWFQRYGVWTLIMAWLPGIGDVLTLIGGLFRTPFLLSLLLVGLAKGARFALFAYAFTGALPWALKWFGQIG